MRHRVSHFVTPAEDAPECILSRACLAGLILLLVLILTRPFLSVPAQPVTAHPRPTPHGASDGSVRVISPRVAQLSQTRSSAGG